MPSVTAPPLSQLVRAQIDRPSPIRQIMKMAERQNILAMGLDPAQVISLSLMAGFATTRLTSIGSVNSTTSPVFHWRAIGAYPL